MFPKSKLKLPFKIENNIKVKIEYKTPMKSA